MIENILLSPLSLAVFLLLLLLPVWRWMPRPLRYAGIALEVLLVMVMAPLGANLLVRVVESRTPAPQSCAMTRPTTIVVLSGGFDRPPESIDDFSAANAESLHRLFAAVGLWRRTPRATLVVVGGGEREIAQAALLARLAERLGVPADSIRMEQDSQTTWQNARDVAAMSPPVSRRIWLVSSALHLPRALGAFRSFGFQPCAWSSGSRYVAFDGIGYFVPQSSSLDKAEDAIHEVVGALVYAWRARNSDADRRNFR